MDRKSLDEFAAQAREGVELKLLADPAYLKPGLKPAVDAWRQQHGEVRPLEARLSTPKAPHDRAIIIDSDEAWEVSQSFEHIAARSPASVTKMPPEVMSLKLPFFLDLWKSSQPL